MAAHKVNKTPPPYICSLVAVHTADVVRPRARLSPEHAYAF